MVKERKVGALIVSKVDLMSSATLDWATMFSFRTMVKYLMNWDFWFVLKSHMVVFQPAPVLWKSATPTFKEAVEALPRDRMTPPFYSEQ